MTCDAVRGRSHGGVGRRPAQPHATVSVRPAHERETPAQNADDMGAAERRTALDQARVHIAMALGYPPDISTPCGTVHRTVVGDVAAL